MTRSSLSALIASFFALGALAQSACSGQQYNNLPGFPAYKSGCYPTSYYRTSDLGSTNPDDAMQRCQSQCTADSQCQSVVAQVNKAADSNNFSGTCFFFNSAGTPTGPRRCADTAYLLEGYYKDNTNACFSSSSVAASAYCSSYLGIPVITSTATSTPPVVTSTTTTTTTPVVTTTSTISETSTATATATLTNISTVTVTVSTTSTSTTPNFNQKRAASTVPAPACVTSNTPATRLSAACSCLSVPTSTSTTTKTLVPVTSIVTATSTTTSTVTAFATVTSATVTTTTTRTTSTTTTVTTTTTSVVYTSTPVPLCDNKNPNSLGTGGCSSNCYCDTMYNGGTTNTGVCNNSVYCGARCNTNTDCPNGQGCIQDSSTGPCGGPACVSYTSCSSTFMPSKMMAVKRLLASGAGSRRYIPSAVMAARDNAAADAAAALARPGGFHSF